jgi:hypothetical protein
MRRVALAKRQPDPSEERLLREYARHCAVVLKEPVLPPVGPVQNFASTWQGWFGR